MKTYRSKLDEHQLRAVDSLKSGSILRGGVGSGKSRTALYFWLTAFGGRDCLVITTPHKRDTNDWLKEAAIFGVSLSRVTVDSWNNIEKYLGVKDKFVIFDEQRVVGRGVWAKSFVKIARQNKWILLTATPGDVWMDYWAVFVANGFYKNRSEFLSRHVVYSRVARYPKIERYVEEDLLWRHRKEITVDMGRKKIAKRETKVMWCQYDKLRYLRMWKYRWDDVRDEPFLDISDLMRGLRRLVGDNEEKIARLLQVWEKHKKVIVFYNFDYELELLKDRLKHIPMAELNGHIHDVLPDGDSWIYLVQYNAGAEAWECTTTNCIVFFSMSYSYKQMEQAAGRIDRRNTPFETLYYYCFATKSSVDLAILNALKHKQNFQERSFCPGKL